MRRNNMANVASVLGSGAPSAAPQGPQGTGGDGGKKSATPELDKLAKELGMDPEKLKEMLKKELETAGKKDSKGGGDKGDSKAGGSGGKEEVGDLNGDGKVDDKDLEIAAKNKAQGKPINTPEDKKGGDPAAGGQPSAAPGIDPGATSTAGSVAGAPV
jgi:hypothetical protein